MKIIALSGGVAAGKNFIADIFAKFGIASFDADAVVHELMKKTSVALDIAEFFPDAVRNNEVDREVLGQIVFSDKDALRTLESIIHPLVKQKCQEFLTQERARDSEFAVLNVPLILEKEGYEYDYLLAIVTDYELRKMRFVGRELQKKPQDVLFLEEKFTKIVANQISDEERIEKADFVIDGQLSEDDSSFEVEEILRKICDS